MDFKVCAACKKDLPVTEYYFRKETGAYRPACKKCKRVKTKDDILNKMNSGKKVCKHCGLEKPSEDFQKAGGGKWLQPYCKPCDYERKKKHKDNNSLRYKELNRENYLSKRVLVSESQKANSRIKSNIALIAAGKKYNEERKLVLTKEERKARKYIQDKKYREKYKNDISYIKKKYTRSVAGKQKAREWQAKMMVNPEFRIVKNFRSRVRVALMGIIKKSDTTENLLGCSFSDFKLYIETQFKDGMTWDNYGKVGWHIDHKIPVSWFNLENPNCQKLAFNFKNHQPLWWEDNLKKNNRYHTPLEEILCKIK